MLLNLNYLDMMISKSILFAPIDISLRKTAYYAKTDDDDDDDDDDDQEEEVYSL